jgi:hypothetical protein
MGHYKSWSGLKKQLEQFLCEEFRGRITYFLARYHQVHNSYGRAAIRLDGNELVCFSWIEMYQQDADLGLQWRESGAYDEKTLKEKWDREKTYHDLDFLDAALQFSGMSIAQALGSENYIIKIFAVLDGRVGKRKLAEIARRREYAAYPDWVRQFYELRLNALCSHSDRKMTSITEKEQSI